MLYRNLGTTNRLAKYSCMSKVLHSQAQILAHCSPCTLKCEPVLNLYHIYITRYIYVTRFVEKGLILAIANI